MLQVSRNLKSFFMFSLGIYVLRLRRLQVKSFQTKVSNFDGLFLHNGIFRAFFDKGVRNLAAILKVPELCKKVKFRSEFYRKVWSSRKASFSCLKISENILKISENWFCGCKRLQIENLSLNSPKIYFAETVRRLVLMNNIIEPFYIFKNKNNFGLFCTKK